MEKLFYENCSEEVEFLPNCDMRTHAISSKDNIPHSHSFYEIFYILEGTIIHSLNGVDTKLSIGDMVFVRPYIDTHYFKRIEGQSCTHRDILFSSKQFYKACTFFEIDPNEYYFGNDYKTRFPINLEYSEIVSLERIVKNILNSIEKNEKTVTTLVNYLIGELVCASILKNTDAPQSKNFPPWFVEFLSLFSKADIIKGGLPELKRHISYSYEHVGRIHKEFLGKTIVQHLTESRMAYAASLLTTTDLSILNIAMKVGYNSLSHFNRTFQKHYNESPHIYRTKNHTT